MLTDPLLLTILIECVALFVLRQKDPIFYLYWTAITTLTNVSANLCLSLMSFDYRAKLCLAVLVIEILVFISELLLCFLYTKNLKKSAKCSAVCNLASFGIGSILLLVIKF